MKYSKMMFLWKKKIIPETSQGNEGLQIQLNTIPKSDQENVNEIFQVLHAQRLFWNLMTKMHYVRPFMLSMTIHKQIARYLK